MAQKGLMRILSRKDGKSMVSDDKDSEKVKFTKVLEFVPARKPEQAKLRDERYYRLSITIAINFYYHYRSEFFFKNR